MSCGGGRSLGDEFLFEADHPAFNVMKVFREDLDVLGEGVEDLIDFRFKSVFNLNEAGINLI